MTYDESVTRNKQLWIRQEILRGRADQMVDWLLERTKISGLRDRELSYLWQETLSYYYERGDEKILDSILERLAIQTKSPLRSDMEYITKSVVFGLVGAFTFNYDLAHDLSTKVGHWLKHRIKSKYRSRLLSSASGTH